MLGAIIAIDAQTRAEGIAHLEVAAKTMDSARKALTQLGDWQARQRIRPEVPLLGRVDTSACPLFTERRCATIKDRHTLMWAPTYYPGNDFRAVRGSPST